MIRTIIEILTGSILLATTIGIMNAYYTHKYYLGLKALKKKKQYQDLIRQLSSELCKHTSGNVADLVRDEFFLYDGGMV
jgi:hypothetical protein